MTFRSRFFTALVLTELTTEVLAPRLGAAESSSQADAGATLASAELFPDTLVARGHGFEVKRSELEQSFMAFSGQEAARGQPIPFVRRAQVEAEILDRLILTRVLLKRASEEDRKSSREKTEKNIKETRTQAASESAFQRRLQALGSSLEQVRARLFEQYASEAVIQREVMLKIKIGEDEVKAHYTTNTAAYTEPESVRVQHILLATRDRLTQSELAAPEKLAKRKLAEELAARARQGEDFAKLARDFSDDLASKISGGEYTLKRGQAVVEFELAAFAIATGQVSDPILTVAGYHVVKSLEHKPAKLLPLADVSQAIKENLQRERGREKLPAYFDRLKKEAGVQILPR